MYNGTPDHLRRLHFTPPGLGGSVQWSSHGIISSLIVHLTERQRNRLHSSELSYIVQVLVLQSIQSKENHMHFHYSGPPRKLGKEVREKTIRRG